VELDIVKIDRVIEKILQEISISDIEKRQFPNVKLYEIVFFNISIPESMKRSTPHLTYIATKLSDYFNFTVFEEAEGFITTDGRLAISVERKR